MSGRLGYTEVSQEHLGPQKKERPD